MSVQDKIENSKKRNNQIVKITLPALLAASLFIIEIYEMVNDPGNFVTIGVLGIFIVAAILAEILIFNSMLKNKEKEQEDAYNNIYRSEKASYLLMRKYFDQMNVMVEDVGKKTDVSIQDLFIAQKALAKMQINKNKENAEALLISNEKMLHRISSFQKEMISAGQNQDEQIEQDGLSQEVFEAKQQEILLAIKELETSLRKEIEESQNKMMESVEKMDLKISNITMHKPQAQAASQYHPSNMEETFSMHDGVSAETARQSTMETAQPTRQGSLESDLDNLLMGINKKAEVVVDGIGNELKADTLEIEFEPEISQIEAEPETEPMAEAELEMLDPEFMMELTGEETETAAEAEPVIAETEPAAETKPVVEAEIEAVMPELEAMMAEIEPEISEPEISQIVEELKIEPAAEAEPVIVEAEPVVAAETEPVMVEAEIEAVMPELETMMAEIEPEISQIAEEPKIEPAAEIEPAVVEAEIEAIMPELELNSIEAEPELGPITAIEPETESLTAATEPETDFLMPELDEPKLEPITAEAEGQELISNSDPMDTELEQIMKEMNIDGVIDQTVEDLDIDKILKKSSKDNKISAQNTLNPRQVMSSEEIESLLANTDLLFQDESEVDTLTTSGFPDSGYIMNSDEIAALIANM